MEINTLHIELEAWAKKKGWKSVTELITRHHYGDLLENLDGISDAAEHVRRTGNNGLIIKRAFREDTPHYQRLAAMLAPAVRAAIDAERAEQKDEQHLVAASTKEHSELICAVLTDAPPAVTKKEAMDSIYSTADLVGLEVQVFHGGRWLSACDYRGAEYAA